MPDFITVRHNIEVAHRLYELPGKCENIHGHSMWVTLTLQGTLDEHGILGGVEFGTLKKEFRGYLDETYDHRLLLNPDDPFAQPNALLPGQTLPGLQVCKADPTTENIVKWIRDHMLATEYGDMVHAVEVQETHVNGARWTRR